METNTEMSGGDCGVLTPRKPESHMQTPMSKKTRAAYRKVENESAMDEEFQPKTPKPTVGAGDAETPRRSARKSVRPPLDYEDIMLRSASKGPVTGHVTGPSTEDNQNDESETHKWSVAEVGRNSGKIKRNRKSKRTGKTLSKEQIPDQVNAVSKSTMVLDGIESAMVAAEQTLETVVKREDVDYMETESESQEQTNEPPVKLRDTNIMETQVAPVLVVKSKGLDDMEINAESQKHVNEPLAKSENQEILKTQPEPAEQAIESVVKSKDLDITATQAVQHLQSIGTTDDRNPAETITRISEFTTESNNMEELGVCPLEFGEEMPSLIVVDDDEDMEKTALNTTFDADAKEDEEIFEIEMPTLQMSPEKHHTVKCTPTEAEDHALIVLSPDQTIGEKHSRPYRLPTPFKTKKGKRVTNASTLDVDEDANSDNNGQRRRSKSFSSMRDIKHKTVSFMSPIEVAHVDDIDRRWDDLNKSNVTKRRRRSKSLDGNFPKPSRLPQPKVYPKMFTSTTPTKIKTRTKVPNFAAMHQRQFDKMENLVDHLERKAERAKILTNSALKKQKQTSSSNEPSAEDRSRKPQALKKIDLPIAAKAQTPSKRATPAKERANVSTRPPLALSENSLAAKPAFNLSTSLAKTFNAKASMPSSTANKVEERRQRHMNMFKGGRTGKDKKADFIRGVRLNRRFELQMQHRRFMEEED